MAGETSGLLVFTHYGDADYLGYSLRQATRSNPSLRRVLIGDAKNRDMAIASGWEHYMLRDFSSPKRDEFNARFRWIQGPDHQPIKGGQDWLRFVFERFFCIAKFISMNEADHFWHFDSDTMILHDLTRYTDAILAQRVACTTLCNDYCPSGLIMASFVNAYCDSMIQSFCDEHWVAAKQLNYEEMHPAEAYTEMPAFCDFRSSAEIRTMHLAAAFSNQGVWFDDSVCQPHSFETFSVPSCQRTLKALRGNCGRIYCRQGLREFDFATINCSWVPLKVYQWIEAVTMSCQPSDFESLADYLAVPLSARVLASFKHLLRRFR